MRGTERWLAGEARWAREQEIRCQREIDDLRDPRLLDRQRRDARMNARRVYWDLRNKLQDARKRIADLSVEHLAATIARLEADRDRWRDLAEGHERRLLDEDQPTLEDA